MHVQGQGLQDMQLFIHLFVDISTPDNVASNDEMLNEY
jgi:hypothetical protein